MSWINMSQVNFFWLFANIQLFLASLNKQSIVGIFLKNYLIKYVNLLISFVEINIIVKPKKK
jgi:hypothetical protein